VVNNVARAIVRVTHTLSLNDASLSVSFSGDQDSGYKGNSEEGLSAHRSDSTVLQS
jgi:hypothetical protein